MGDRLDLVLRNDLGELERLAAAVDDFAERNGLSPALAFALNLCLDELVTNTVSYGYGADGTDGRRSIRLRVECDEAEVRAELEDDAAAFDPFHEAPPPDLEGDIDERRVGGLGVFLVRQSMDRVAYRRAGDRNIVTLAKARTA
ncbi:anti-sigma regulatory factor (Ser/Thr protein kinase) [Azospirillum agricola]|uniref:ATP-binding protein n=1 Tax=Azospirillum agricola TaxID=1720247 RepID=UPI001AE2C20F|nr:ATP-binding protein [Azospirillum agricola]MBP2230373.1 anti-sigma regulatory factor (Ser/Thr protein kinase) [Azospirillum agricola]